MCTPNVINSLHIFLFTVDLKLIKIISYYNDVINLQIDINNIQTRCSINRLPLNINTCKCMRFNFTHSKTYQL